MRNNKTNLNFGFWLITLGLLLSACQSDSPSSGTSPEKAPTVQVEAQIEIELPTLEVVTEAQGNNDPWFYIMG